jgi:protein gp37
MGENSKIEWTDHTFNPWIGCSKVSAGCAHCYAEALMDRRMGMARWGDGGTRVRTSVANWKKPLKWNRDAKRSGKRARVFCASLADVFEDRPELVGWREELFDLIAYTPWLDWLLLTKRPENVGRMTKGTVAAGGHGGRLRFNMWLGTSVESQETADKRIPELLKVSAAVRFLSVEPMLGPVQIEERWLRGAWDVSWSVFPRIDWVICGGESGPGARPMNLDWARSLRDQCKAAGVPFFFKQVDKVQPIPDDLMIREFPISPRIKNHE